MSDCTKLIKWLRCSHHDFYELLSKSKEEKYDTFYIKKRNGGLRKIEAPVDPLLISIQSKLSGLFYSIYGKYLPKSAFGYVKGKSIKDNARIHLGNKYIVKIDLKDFFENITYIRIYEMLKKAIPKANSKTLKAITMLTTCDGHLPQGGITSPVLSNMICKRMDKELKKYSSLIGAKYSRYADDIFFSFNDIQLIFSFIESSLSSKPLIINNDLNRIIESNGFKINKHKTKFLTPNCSKNICGLVINEKINVRRDFIRNLRQDIYKAKIKGVYANKKIVGKGSYLRFIRGTNDELAVKYCSNINRISQKPYFQDSDFLYNSKAASEWYVVRITMPNEEYGSAIFADGFLITSKHVVESRKFDEVIKNTEMRDYFHEFDIGYYPEFGCSYRAETKKCLVKEAFVLGEIALLQIDCYDQFKNRSLKISNDVWEMDQEVLTLGCQSSNSTNLGIIRNKAKIIQEENWFSSVAISLNPNAIFKGMSGGPVLDLSTYSVIGINLSGGNRIERLTTLLDSSFSPIVKSNLKSISKWEMDPITEAKIKNKSHA